MRKKYLTFVSLIFLLTTACERNSAEVKGRSLASGYEDEACQVTNLGFNKDDFCGGGNFIMAEAQLNCLVSCFSETYEVAIEGEAPAVLFRNSKWKEFTPIYEFRAGDHLRGSYTIHHIYSENTKKFLILEKPERFKKYDVYTIDENLEKLVIVSSEEAKRISSKVK